MLNNPNLELGTSPVTIVMLFAAEMREVQLAAPGAKIRA